MRLYIFEFYREIKTKLEILIFLNFQLLIWIELLFNYINILLLMKSLCKKYHRSILIPYLAKCAKTHQLKFLFFSRYFSYKFSYIIHIITYNVWLNKRVYYIQVLNGGRVRKFEQSCWIFILKSMEKSAAFHCFFSHSNEKLVEKHVV